MQDGVYTPFNGSKPKSQKLKLVVTTALATIAVCCAIFMLIGNNVSSQNVILAPPYNWNR